MPPQSPLCCEEHARLTLRCCNVDEGVRTQDWADVVLEVHGGEEQGRELHLVLVEDMEVDTDDHRCLSWPVEGSP